MNTTTRKTETELLRERIEKLEKDNGFLLDMMAKNFHKRDMLAHATDDELKGILNRLSKEASKEAEIFTSSLGQLVINLASIRDLAEELAVRGILSEEDNQIFRGKRSMKLSVPPRFIEGDSQKSEEPKKKPVNDPMIA